MGNLIVCKSVSVKYDSGVAVRDVSFQVSEGDYLCIVGENGSGKTSLMRAMVGLTPLFDGKITFEGLRQNEIGYLPQQTNVQKDFPANVMEVVLSGCLSRHGLKPFYTKQDKRRAEENMERLKISNLRNKSFRDLSGGQRQRILLARALCATEKLLLLDEPITGLDPLMAAEMYELLHSLNEQGLTIVMISHDVKSAIFYVKTILHLGTESLFFGTTKDYALSDVARSLIGGKQND
ncbi:MAG: metal ABC transporter ATP-binding protein [Clostridiales Family XIII bacterium]|jgi:zinc transport system ATP-binding protein|nr:metal ABC transporter ATP-binding protein [Clostridiales Family XIII bacterium]